MSFIQIMTATETKEQAEVIARSLVEAHLAACVQIMGGIESTYRWRGKVEYSNEFLCLIKTREDLFAEVAAVIKTLHSYDTPEIIAVPIIAGSPEYLAWLAEAMPEGR